MGKNNIYNRLMADINNTYGVCGAMGNLYAESGLKSNNAQNSGNKRLGMTDEEYTAKTDSGEYGNFVRDSIGYGLAQWTYWSRKQALMEFCKSRNASIGDENAQVDFLLQELKTSYKSVYNVLKNAKSIKEASDYFCKTYERPADQSAGALAKRQKYGEGLYKEFVGNVVQKEPSNSKYLMTATQFIEKLKFAASKKTLYIKGCFGAPMTEANKKRYSSNLAYNANRKAMIYAADDETFGFDCVCLIKGILWGWKADKTKNYGGASYNSNGVPDMGADQLMKYCTEVSTDFSKIVPGEALWMPGHVGVYIGDGVVIECTPRWSNNVQYSNLGNLGKRTGHWRDWKQHGKLKWIDYTV